jgi:CxxC motif-containing protein (DUF1111 family)
MRREPLKTSTVVAGALILAMAAALPAQTDPGPRPGGPGGPQAGPPSAGRPLDGLTGAQLDAFDRGRNEFVKIQNVPDGLGPRFNFDSCVGCHAQPAPGGSSPRVNPQLAVAAKLGAINQVPPFIQQNGPVRVVRFRRAADGTADGGVHDLFVVSGRADVAAACQLAQPDFTNQQNIVFRIPTPTFGLGLIEQISDSALRANLAADGARKRAAGVRGRFNTSGNDGTITRFGWKAQNKSLLQFSGEAYNVEMGISNSLFPQEREENSACASIAAPNDPGPSIAELADFMRFLAPPQPSPSNASIESGRALFDTTGCALCHTPSIGDARAYSDLALHRMGQALNDGITQGAAQGDEWRTAPLWGLGDRLFLLHDGRSHDLLDAIRQHDSQGSEAHSSVVSFQALSDSQKQDLLNFLRSL